MTLTWCFWSLTACLASPFVLHWRQKVMWVWMAWDQLNDDTFHFWVKYQFKLFCKSQIQDKCINISVYGFVVLFSKLKGKVKRRRRAVWHFLAGCIRHAARTAGVWLLRLARNSVRLRPRKQHTVTQSEIKAVKWIRIVMWVHLPPLSLHQQVHISGNLFHNIGASCFSPRLGARAEGGGRDLGEGQTFHGRFLFLAACVGDGFPAASLLSVQTPRIPEQMPDGRK